MSLASLIEAAQRQMKTLPFYHSFNSKASDVIGALAQEIIELAPVPMSKVFFANSGSEAIDTAMILGTGFPPYTGGLLRYADSVGIAKLVIGLERLAGTAGEIFQPTGLLLDMAEKNRSFYSS